MHVGVIGAGAMGGLFGALLDRAGHEVSIVDTDRAVVAAIEESGIRVEGDERDGFAAFPEITTDPGSIGTVDVLFVFVKSNYTGVALDSAGPMLGPETSVVTLQNGLSNFDVLRERVGEARALGGYTTLGANTAEPGRVRQVGGGKSVLGGGDGDRAGAVADLLNDAGLRTEAVPDPLPHIWDKQFVNVGVKPVAALTELRNGRLAEEEATRDAIRALIEEALAVARARDIEVIAEDPVSHTFEVLRDKGDKKSSILEDVERGRRTEIDYINGAVVEYGRDLGVPTPHNELAVNLVRGKEAGYLE